MSLLLKIRLTLIFTISIALFATIGWTLAQPWDPIGTVTLATHHQPIQLMVGAVMLGLITTAVSIKVAGPDVLKIAPMAVPAGLCSWAVMTGNMEKLLLGHFEISDRVEMFHNLAYGTVGWLAIVLTGYLLVVFVAGEKKMAAVSESEPASKKNNKTRISDVWWVRGIGALALTCVIGTILMKFFARSETVMIPDDDLMMIEVSTTPVTSQIIFAVGGAFLLATVVSYQLFRGRMWCYLLAPAIVAIIAYVGAAPEAVLEPLAGAAPMFVISSSTYATILPVQYVGVGSLMVMIGYWGSDNIVAGLGIHGHQS